MKVTILFGSPRPSGCTATLLRPFTERLAARGAEVEVLDVTALSIAPCRGCYACQDVTGAYGCAQKDDMERVANAVAACDAFVLACPIYSWYCPAEMKAVIDRFYGMNKFYGAGTGSLWKGKHMALLLAHGYERDDACGPFASGMKNLCAHSSLHFFGLYSVRDVEGPEDFATPEAVRGAEAFADRLIEAAGRKEE